MGPIINYVRALRGGLEKSLHTLTLGGGGGGEIARSGGLAGIIFHLSNII